MQDSHLTCDSETNNNCDGEVKIRPPLEGGTYQQWSVRCDWHQREIEELQREVNELRAQRDELLRNRGGG